MKSFFAIAVTFVTLLVLTSCHSNPPAQVVYTQPAPVQQAPSFQGDPNQFYSDPDYTNQPPVQYVYNGQQLLIDAALMAYFTSYHINPGYYYSTHPGYAHFHVYSNGVYSGYPRGYNHFVTVNHYHYIAPNPRYVTKNGAPDMRYKANQVNYSRKSFSSHTSSSFGRHR